MWYSSHNHTLFLSNNSTSRTKLLQKPALLALFPHPFRTLPRQLSAFVTWVTGSEIQCEAIFFNKELQHQGRHYLRIPPKGAPFLLCLGRSCPASRQRSPRADGVGVALQTLPLVSTKCADSRKHERIPCEIYLNQKLSSYHLERKPEDFDEYLTAHEIIDEWIYCAICVA